jgi:hypothetical protein
MWNIQRHVTNMGAATFRANSQLQVTNGTGFTDRLIVQSDIDATYYYKHSWNIVNRRLLQNVGNST